MDNKVLLVLTGFAFLVGCTPGFTTKTPLGPDVDNGDVEEIEEMAIAETGCTDEPMTYSHVGGRRHRMEGCGMQADYAFACVEYCGWLKISDLKSRASFEMGCDAITVHEISEGTWGAEGCGQRATYLQLSRGLGNYEWILDSATKPQPTAL